MTLALAGFLAASALAGRLLGAGARRPATVALLLTTSMRGFRIAAGLATAAFGPAAAAPLGGYGILVLARETAAAEVLRQRHTGGPLPPIARHTAWLTSRRRLQADAVGGVSLA